MEHVFVFNIGGFGGDGAIEACCALASANPFKLLTTITE